jgi:uncharacterized membrane protein
MSSPRASSPLSWGSRGWYQVLVEQRFFAVALPSAAACVLLGGRFVGSGTRQLSFMAWNLLLAWIPYVCSFVAVAVHRSRLSGRGGRVGIVGLAGAAWLAFLPNAPYMTTDLFRLRDLSSAPVFYDVALLATFAWSGCVLGVASLQAMQSIIADVAGQLVARASTLLFIGLSGIGMYLGRMVRLNSWDLAFRPGHVLAHATEAVASRVGFFYSLLFGGFFFVCYVAMAPAPAPAMQARSNGL